MTIPIVDLDPFIKAANPAAQERVIREVGHACGTWGAFQIVNHGIGKSLLSRVEKAQRDFFALPRSEKRAISRTKANVMGYYDRELTKNTRDKKEVFDFRLERPGESTGDHPENDAVDGVNQWPEALPGLRETMLEYIDACEKLALKLTEMICLSLGLPFDRLHLYLVDSQTSFIRLNYYPTHDPLANEPDSATADLGAMGVHHHSDAGILTLVLQDDVGGLEVYREGKWYPAVPVKDALFVNLADMLQVFTNDRYKAPQHRVLASSGKERYSVPFFYNPSYASDCYPLEAFVGAENPARYTKINWGDFRKRRSDGDYADYGNEVQIADYRVG